ncbi:MAG TPA: hypothetical protein VEY33_05530, partial [Gemmatimonadota bacterium]|nr:hypothetical protein [Gemmatimonadota bacterium]
MIAPNGARPASTSAAPLAGRFFLLAAIATFGTGCRSTPPPSSTPPPGPATVPALAAEPTVRIGVALGDTSLALGSGDRWWIHEAGASRPIAVVEGEPGWRVVRLPFETSLRLRRPDGWLS